MSLGAGDDVCEINAPKGYPCGKAAQRQRDAFEKSLPMSRAEFERLFEFLDEGLAHRGCDGTHRLTLEFLRARRASNEAAVLDFCEQNGGYCDCVVLNNVQDRFEF